jgi:outer membrane protein assembly factor BamC
LAVLALAAALSGCSTIENLLSGDKIDYRSSSKSPSKSLEVPPDLTQLARENRYQVPGGVVSAAAAGAPTSTTATVATVAPTSIGQMRIERMGNQRWLVVPVPPEQLWPRLRSFWQERGFSIAVESAEAGILETDWAENRAKLPKDGVRAVIGRLFDNVYDTGERDRFRTRVERTAGGSEIYISHRGMVEVYTGQLKDNTMWQYRPADPELEAEFLARLMVSLGAREDVARPLVAKAPDAPARARIVGAAPAATLEVDEPFDRAWRRLGLALDRSGFSVEDRDRAAGLYFVRYVDPKDADKGEPNFFSRLFGGGSGPGGPLRYRISVKGEGQKTTVSVLSSSGAPERSENAQRIVAQLVGELR